MTADLSDLLLAGTVAVATATLALVLMVSRDLAPAGSRGPLSGGGRQWLLGAILGIGVITFTLKTIVIVAVSTFPGHTVTPLLAEPGTTPVDPEHAAGPNVVAEPDASAPSPYVWKTLPSIVPAPPDNPTTPEKVALGARLFRDPALSRDRTVSCASCHDVDAGAGTDSRATATGISGVPGRRNVPTVWNAAFQAKLFWDGRANSLEEQALGPPLDPDEMGMPSVAAIEERIGSDLSYRDGFAAAFGAGTPVTMRLIVQAIAAYERTLVAADAPYDRFVAGDPEAMSAAQQRGMWLFRSIGCTTCHSGPNFSGASLVGPKSPYALLLADRSDDARTRGLGADKGKAAPDAPHGVWRIPSLRNVALTSPYFHNGRVDDLREAVHIMATAQLNAVISDDSHLRRIPVWSAERRTFSAVDRLILDHRDIDDLVAFLGALSSDTLAARVAARTPP